MEKDPNLRRAALSVIDLIVVPKPFFVPEIIEKRGRWRPPRAAPAGSVATYC